jgi:hypothetical protein
MPTTPPLISPIAPREFPLTLWFKRSWKWVVPVGAAVLAACFLGFLAGIAYVIKQCDAYKVAVHRSTAAPGVVAQLGEPIREGWFLSGNVQLTNDDGVANLAIPLKGPKGSATVYVYATKKAGQWHFRQVIVVPDGNGQKVDLSDPP